MDNTENRNMTLGEFEKAYDSYGSTVYGLASAMLKTQKDAAALTREVFTEIIHTAHGDGDTPLSLKLFKSTVNKCNKILDSEVTPTDWEAVWEKQSEEREENVSGIAQDELLKLFPHIAQFDIKQRAVLILSSQKLDPQTVADIMDLPKQTVEWMLSQNKKELKDAGVTAYNKYLKEIGEILKANGPALKFEITDAESSKFSAEPKKKFPTAPICIVLAAVLIAAALTVYFLVK